jgi:hypothetical protein
VSRPPSWGRLLGAQSGVFGLEVGVVGFEFIGAAFQVQNLGDPGDVDALGDELADALQAVQIVDAVSASAAVGARRGEQYTPLVEPQRLRINRTARSLRCRTRRAQIAPRNRQAPSCSIRRELRPKSTCKS